MTFKLFRTKKVSINDVASKQPSKEAKNAVNRAINAAHKDQEAIRHQARALRAN
jgi:hypothetical protein